MIKIPVKYICYACRERHYHKCRSESDNVHAKTAKTDVINLINNVIFVFDVTLTDNVQYQS